MARPLHSLGELTLRLPGAVGRRAIGWTGEAGRAAIFLGRAVLGIVRRPVRVAETVVQVHFFGNRSIPLILLTASFTGMVLTLQGYHVLVRFGSDAYLGPLVALSLVRELGPVLGALMVTARAGSAVAASIGSMRISEQIDALEAMAVDPIQYLATPRLIAAVIAVPLITTVFDLVGIGAAYALGVAALRIDGGTFMSMTRDAVLWSDVSTGLWKSFVFAVIIAWIATYRGYTASGGALGVGRATTEAVVAIAALVLAADYVMTAWMF